jgi:hypothetical protein
MTHLDPSVVRDLGRTYYKGAFLGLYGREQARTPRLGGNGLTWLEGDRREQARTPRLNAGWLC